MTMNRRIALVLSGFFLACGSTTPDTPSDASDAATATTTPPLDPSCESYFGCAVWDCICTTARGAVRSNNATGGCQTAEAICKSACDGYGQPYKTPVACVKRVDAGPQVDAATPEDGRPGGACNKIGEKCLVSSCQCNNGTAHFPVSAPCVNGICQGQAEACPPACAKDGGWSGKGQD